MKANDNGQKIKEISQNIGFKRRSRMVENNELADRVGFEPTVGLHPRRFSRPLP
jgi:hypothetical protein